VGGLDAGPLELPEHALSNDVSGPGVAEHRTDKGGGSTRLFLLVCLVVFSTTAYAGEFPVSAAYGTPSACAAFAKGGTEAVEAGDDLSAVLVTPSELVAAALVCPAEKAQVRGIEVTVECVLAGDQPFELTARIEENAAEKTVTYSSAIATAVLSRCE
jgi:hypothetical protein